MLLLAITIIFFVVQGLLLLWRKLKPMRRIVVYITFVFGITYLVDDFLIDPLVAQYGYGTDPRVIAAVALTMFVPALSVLLTRVVTREGFADVWIRPHFKGNVRHYLAAWLLPPALVAVGAAIYFLCFPSNFAPSMHSAIDSMNALAGAERQMSYDAARPILFGQLALSVVAAPILNCVACFGEEWGWRGYLLPRTLEFIDYEKSPRAWKLALLMVVNGVIWGLWHAPLIAAGHNYGTDYAGQPWLGIAAMCLFTFSLGVLFSYWSWKSHSCLPGVVGHGAVNGIAAGANFFAVGNPTPLLGPHAAGVLGGSAFLVAALVVLIIWCRETKKAALARQEAAPQDIQQENK